MRYLPLLLIVGVAVAADLTKWQLILREEDKRTVVSEGPYDKRTFKTLQECEAAGSKVYMAPETDPMHAHILSCKVVQ